MKSGVGKGISCAMEHKLLVWIKWILFAFYFIGKQTARQLLSLFAFPTGKFSWRDTSCMPLETCWPLKGFCTHNVLQKIYQYLFKGIFETVHPVHLKVHIFPLDFPTVSKINETFNFDTFSVLNKTSINFQITSFIVSILLIYTCSIELHCTVFLGFTLFAYFSALHTSPHKARLSRPTVVDHCLGSSINK